jgi:hypothetical protein
MQIGTRWKAHTTPPSSLPPEYLYAIAEQEAELRPLKVDTSNWHWTLTYLEGRAIVELDDGTRISSDVDGTLHITQE